MNLLDFPLRIDGRGRVATTDLDEHIRDMIVQVLFTRPGERLNRADFGCGVQQLVFSPNNEVLATTTQVLVHGALHRWLGDLIEIGRVRIASEGNVLVVDIAYRRKDTGEPRHDRFAAPGPAL